ncbi:hypothetical protein STENM327S_05182 [Streptomyces tendae]
MLERQTRRVKGAATAEGGSSMSHDSAAAPEAAARKLSGRRRQGDRRGAVVQRRPHPREFHTAVGVRDRPPGRRRASLPLLVCAGEEGAAADHRGRTHRATGLEAISRAGTGWYRPGGRSPRRHRRRRSTRCAGRTRRGRAWECATGAFVLAAAGLLDGRPATTRWMYAPTLPERWRRVHVDPRELFVDDGDVLTSAGTAAGMRPVPGATCARTTATRRPERWRAGWCRPRAAAATEGCARQVFTGGDRRRPARRGRRLGAGAPPRAVRRGDAGRARLHGRAPSTAVTSEAANRSSGWRRSGSAMRGASWRRRCVMSRGGFRSAGGVARPPGATLGAAPRGSRRRGRPGDRQTAAVDRVEPRPRAMPPSDPPAALPPGERGPVPDPPHGNPHAGGRGKRPGPARPGTAGARRRAPEGGRPRPSLSAPRAAAAAGRGPLITAGISSWVSRSA